MNTHQRIYLGGLGALTPILLNLLTVDCRTIFVGLTLLVFLGYLLRVVVLFYIGGLVAFLHREERSKFRLFELGILAPALITGLLNGSHVQTFSWAGEVASRVTIPPFLGLSAYAQSPPESSPASVQRGPAIQQGALQQLWTGLTGSSQSRLWYIVVATAATRQDANRIAQDFLGKFPKRYFYIYLPSEHTPNYIVVLGEGLSYDAAELERRKAIRDGFPDTLCLWQPREIQVRQKVVAKGSG